MEDSGGADFDRSEEGPVRHLPCSLSLDGWGESLIQIPPGMTLEKSSRCGNIEDLFVYL